VAVNDSHIQCWLLAESDPNYKKAHELVLALEAAHKNNQDLQAKSSSLNFIKPPDFLKLLFAIDVKALTKLCSRRPSATSVGR